MKNMNSGKFCTLTLALIASIIMCVAFVGCTGNDKTSSGQESPKIHIVQGSYAIDVDDIDAVMGDADYVFVGKVIDKIGTKDVSENREIAYTQYEVQVLKNIKGNLITDKPIKLDKAGGYSETDQLNYIYEDDFLPKASDICVFYSYAQPDGTLGVTGPNSTIKLEVDGKARSNVAYKNDENYKKAEAAADTQIVRDRERSVSDYEKK